MKHAFFFLLFSLFSIGVYAQENNDWERYLEHLATLDEAESTSWEEVHQVLSEFSRNPININQATEDDLRQLLFLNEKQIDEIMTYLGKYHGMRTKAELNMLRELDTDRKMLLSCVIYIGEMAQNKETFRQLLRNAGHEAVAMVGIPLYERLGQTNGKYEGGALRHWLRYNMNAKNRMRWGFIAAQDAGEPLFKGKNKSGYDHYSFYFQLRRFGVFDNLVVGRYKIKTGMGLIINNGLALGKASLLSTNGNTTNILTAHSSKSEFNYLQGAAAVLHPHPSVWIMPFLSFRYLDGTLNKDSTTLYNIAGSGYHRTESELGRKHNTSLATGGVHLRLVKNGFYGGATFIFNRLSRSLQPMKTDSLGQFSLSQLYRMWLPQGQQIWNLGVNYGYNRGNISVNGETAYGNCNAIASINAASYSFSSKFALTALYRFYAFRYYALQSLSFSDGGSTQNESGLYVGANWRITKDLTLSSYADMAYFPWPKYQTLGSSRGWDIMTNLLYLHKSLTIQARYRYRNKQRDNEEKTSLIPKQDHRGLLAVEYSHNHFTLKTKASLSYCNYQKHSLGYLLEQHGRFQSKRFNILGSIGYFHTQDYYSRVYSYERTLLYMMNIPSFAGKGCRYALLASFQFRNIQLSGKWGTTHYFDRTSISSGLQQINQATQTDIDLQLRYSF